MKGDNTDDYINDRYHKSRYIASYQFMMQPIRSSKFWEPTNHEAPQPLRLKKKIGRKKRRRRMAEGEVLGQQRMSRHGTNITCSYCRLACHNIKCCQLMKQQQPLRQGERPSEETVGEMQTTRPSESIVLQSTTRTPVTRRTPVSHETEQLVRRRQCRRWSAEGLA